MRRYITWVIHSFCASPNHIILSLITDILSVKEGLLSDRSHLLINCFSFLLINYHWLCTCSSRHLSIPTPVVPDTCRSRHLSIPTPVVYLSWSFPLLLMIYSFSSSCLFFFLFSSSLFWYFPRCRWYQYTATTGCSCLSLLVYRVIRLRSPVCFCLYLH